METYYCGIPVIDLQKSTDEKVIADQFVEALSKVGFVYIKNEGVDQSMLEQAFSHSAKFFDLSNEVKRKYMYDCGENKPASGFVPSEKEQFDHDKPLDIKEAFDISSELGDLQWPSDGDVPGFRTSMSDLLIQVKNLSQRLFHLVGLGLNLQNPDNLKESCENEEGILLRILDYPKIQDMFGLLPGQLRCTEHTDYGWLTILYQDDCGGLEVMNTNGEFVEATPLKGAALVNVGDFLSMCTGGTLKSTTHRVVITEKNFSRRRQSIVLFCDPDGEAVVEPLCSAAENIQSISYNQLRNKRYAETGTIAN